MEGRGNDGKERRQGSPDVNSTKNLLYCMVDTIRECICTVHEYSMHYPSRGPKTEPSDFQVELVKNLTPVDAGKAWFTNNNKGSEAGLNIGKARLRPRE